MSCKIVETIQKMKDVRHEMSRISRYEHSLFTPIMSDLHLIPHIVSVFKEYEGINGIMDVRKRKVLLFIVMMLYAPRKLFGKYMPKNINRVLATSLNIKRSVVSDNTVGLIVEFEIYKDFQAEVCDMYDRVTKRLYEDGMLPQKS